MKVRLYVSHWSRSRSWWPQAQLVLSGGNEGALHQETALDAWSDPGDLGAQPPASGRQGALPLPSDSLQAKPCFRIGNLLPFASLCRQN